MNLLICFLIQKQQYTLTLQNYKHKHSINKVEQKAAE